MIRIRFQGKEYLFGSDRMGEEGFIATREQYVNGEASYAHVNEIGAVMRFGDSIGHINEAEVLEMDVPDPLHEPDTDISKHLSGVFTDPSWRRP